MNRTPPPSKNMPWETYNNALMKDIEKELYQRPRKFHRENLTKDEVWAWTICLRCSRSSPWHLGHFDSGGWTQYLVSLTCFISLSFLLILLVIKVQVVPHVVLLLRAFILSQKLRNTFANDKKFEYETIKGNYIHVVNW